MYQHNRFRIVPSAFLSKAGGLALTFILFTSIISQSAMSASPRARPKLSPGETNRIQLSTAALPAITTQDLNSGLTPADLVTALLGPGVVVSNVTFTGSNSAAGTFAGGTGIIGFEGGIMLSSGDIASAPGPNTQDDVSGVNAGFGDPDLDGLIPGFTTFDACLLEFDFQCEGTQVIQFQYVFTSEEYNEWVNSPFNDVFGFFLNGENIALVPGSQGTPVSINNVNCDNPYNPPAGSFCNLFINNDCNDIPPGTFPCNGAVDIQMDGMIVILTATGTLSPGMNHIKLALADAGDQVLDSNVFIRAQSFTCGEPTGACCDTGTQSCSDNITQANCQGSGMAWTVGLACNQLNPPCTSAIHPDGTDCTNPIAISSLPFVESNTTSGKANDYTNTCLGDFDNGYDILYELTTSSTQCLDVTVTGETPNDNWIGVAIDSTCPIDTSCIAMGTSQTNVATITNLTLPPGTYYLMIDRWPLASASLDFTLSITDCSGAPTGACCNTENQVCIDNVLEANCDGVDDLWSIGVACGDLNPPCAPEVDPPGQDCEFPLFITSVLFDDINTTVDKKEDYSNTCLGDFDDGDDVVYEINLSSAHCVDITVAGASANDHSIGVVLDNACPPGSACLAHVTTTGTVATIGNLQLDAGTYYLMIDRMPDDEGFAVLDFRLTIADCPAASGACCLSNGQCTQVTEADCFSANGLTWTEDTSCSPNPCEALTLTCPADITVSADVGFCTAVVEFPDPVVTPSDTPVSCEPPSGSTFTEGTTMVNCTASNEQGTANCSFEVTVVEDQPLSLVCPDNKTVQADAGSCSAVVTYDLPTVSGTCVEAEINCDPPSGAAFALGETPVTCSATDGAESAQCDFVVTVATGDVCPHKYSYWAKHPEVWPVESLHLGEQSYTKPQLMAILLNSPRADASLHLAQQLIAALLNTAAGSDPAPVCETIVHANDLLGGFTGMLPYHVKFNTMMGQAMLSDMAVLKSYNLGQLTPECQP